MGKPSPHRETQTNQQQQRVSVCLYFGQVGSFFFFFFPEESMSFFYFKPYINFSADQGTTKHGRDFLPNRALEGAGASTSSSTHRWEKKECPFRNNHPTSHGRAFDSGAWVLSGSSNPCPAITKRPNPAWPTPSTARCPWRHSPSLFHYGMPRPCQVTKSKQKPSGVTGTVLACSSPPQPDVMQWAGSPPWAPFFKLRWLVARCSLPTHSCIWQQLAAIPHILYTQVSLQFNVLRISKDRHKSVCLL